MFFSPTTSGFYSPEIHGSAIPADAVEITADEHVALLAGQSAGKRIVAGPGGRPVLADPPAPSPEQLQAARNAEALAYLASTDWYVIRQQETGEAIPADVLAARQAARAAVVHLEP